MISNFRVFVISLHLQFAERKINKRITKTRKNESTKKRSLFYERPPNPAHIRPQRQGKQRTATDRPLPQVNAGVIRIKFHPKMSKINCRRQVVVSGNPGKPRMRILGLLVLLLSTHSKQLSSGFCSPRLKKKRRFGATSETRVFVSSQ